MIADFSTIPLLLGTGILAWRLRRHAPRQSFWLLISSCLFLIVVLASPIVMLMLARTQTAAGYGRSLLWLQGVAGTVKCLAGLLFLAVAFRWQTDSHAGKPAAPAQWNIDHHSGTSATHRPYDPPR